ncbi:MULTISPECIES: alternate-type signal peptide domain-containing protein [Janibacter]|nr:alternate-type signal peptide domain-containing protein [Janibacter melonis]MCB5992995.1 alternate-type signal peptide domain-containing protein [Janibacter melonis]
MSRTTTSLVAVGAGVILLSAAGGSFAQWSEGKDVAPGSITAGHLDMQVDGGGWFDTKGTSDTGDDTSITPSAFKMVPGDEVEYRAKVRPNLVGNTLKAQLTANLPGVSNTLKDHVVIATKVDGADSVTVTSQDTASGKAYDARVTVTMPFDDVKTNGTAGEDKTLDLNTLRISLVQQQR